MKQIIPYTSEALRWHLANNVFNLEPDTLEKIIDTCEKVNAGELGLDNFITADSKVTIAEMLDDLLIDYNQPVF